ncbi:hypothetical protein COOONC_27741, partial [Cooperia oncophora]
LSSVNATTPIVLPTSSSEKAISQWAHSRVPSEEPHVFARSGSLKVHIMPSRPSLPSSESMAGVQDSKMEPPKELAPPFSDKESPQSSKDSNYLGSFPAGPSVETIYFSSSSTAEKKALPPEPPVDYNDQQTSKENAPPASVPNGTEFAPASWDFQSDQDGGHPITSVCEMQSASEGEERSL